MTTMPLYKNHGIDNPFNLKATANPGLLFERFYCNYSESWETDNTGGKAGTDFLTNFPKTVGKSATLERYRENTLSLVSALKGEYWAMQSQWHFVTGLGIDHPLENGLLWHPVLGTPFLPGSSLKGMARAWLELHDYDQAVVTRAFGHSTGEEDMSAGEAIFFDALPIFPVDLCIDTMTPHMDKWYSDGESRPGKSDTVPADWHAPVPVRFLAAKNIDLLFGVAPRVPSAENLVKQVVRPALEAALRHLGAGAKTAAGYGSFGPPGDKTEAIFKKAQEAQKLEAMSDSERILEEVRKGVALRGNQQPHSEFQKKLDEYLEQAVDWPKADGKALADLAWDFFIQKRYGSKKHESRRKRLIAALREK